ncbi:GNAT family N-acetyltransferase [Ornithinibacillus halophilus]|uniref:Protein N-acetyltransferase, RimJ/RimL family n=1 Tax=Ornithinibacillus halophilus TaxID=930117 RepID=A0A1M5LHK3_9BACI|nr:GNAT family N-acetyltransferase [Ornithinibacillus halophilus]SHG64420.1 Protein N-acetyltransferase, RimJ/RimL family [Ornithinibacillus halophilus]
MEVKLEKATMRDANSIFDMQVKAFTPLLEKYKDYDTNPANETIDRVLMRINSLNRAFYKILADNELVGAISVKWEGNAKFWISPMFLIPSYQGKGIAQEALILLEKMYPQAMTWELATIKEEERNCYLYEKMGYNQTGVSKKLNDNATLIYYKKA